MSVTVSYLSQATVTEIISNNTISASAKNRTVVHDQLNTTQTLNGVSSPAVSMVAEFQGNMTAGTLSIDLTSLTGTNGAATNMTGLKVQIFKVIALANNANNITLVQGASNGYNLMGSFSVTLAPGQEFLFYGNAATPAIGSGARILTMTGTLSQGADFVVVAG